MARPGGCVLSHKPGHRAEWLGTVVSALLLHVPLEGMRLPLRLMRSWAYRGKVGKRSRLPGPRWDGAKQSGAIK